MRLWRLFNHTLIQTGPPLHHVQGQAPRSWKFPFMEIPVHGNYRSSKFPFMDVISSVKMSMLWSFTCASSEQDRFHLKYKQSNPNVASRRLEWHIATHSHTFIREHRFAVAPSNLSINTSLVSTDTCLWHSAALQHVVSPPHRRRKCASEPMPQAIRINRNSVDTPMAVRRCSFRRWRVGVGRWCRSLSSSGVDQKSRRGQFVSGQCGHPLYIRKPVNNI